MGKSMKQSDFAKALAERAGVTVTEAKRLLDAQAGVVMEALKGGTEVTVPHLAKFKRAHTKARTGRNPKTGEAIDIPAGTTVRASSVTALKNAVR